MGILNPMLHRNKEPLLIFITIWTWAITWFLGNKWNKNNTLKILFLQLLPAYFYKNNYRGYVKNKSKIDYLIKLFSDSFLCYNNTIIYYLDCIIPFIFALSKKIIHKIYFDNSKHGLEYFFLLFLHMLISFMNFNKFDSLRISFPVNGNAWWC